ncbi:MAG: endonuclease III [Candidatus Zixiibacteriota bacterium]|nr:MAG: endonuclease III [candidate division Zixibacteria bacterium]
MGRSTLLKKIVSIDKKLTEMYGEKKQFKFRDPTEELILTILSQNTNDVNRDRAFRSLKAEFPGWGAIAQARSASIAGAIKVGGLANIKSGRIKKILKQIGEKSEDYSISFIKKMTDNEAWEYLMSYEGVGPKTAACVMLFSLGRDFMPVDTHVHRVSKRLGLIPENMNAEKAHDWYREMKPPVSFYRFHLNLIEHGRNLCRPAKPKCPECGLKRQCVYFKRIGND